MALTIGVAVAPGHPSFNQHLNVLIDLDDSGNVPGETAFTRIPGCSRAAVLVKRLTAALLAQYDARPWKPIWPATLLALTCEISTVELAHPLVLDAIILAHPA